MTRDISPKFGKGVLGRGPARTGVPGAPYVPNPLANPPSRPEAGPVLAQRLIKALAIIEPCHLNAHESRLSVNLAYQSFAEFPESLANWVDTRIRLDDDPFPVLLETLVQSQNRVRLVMNVPRTKLDAVEAQIKSHHRLSLHLAARVDTDPGESAPAPSDSRHLTLAALIDRNLFLAPPKKR